MNAIRQVHYPRQATIDAYGDGGFRFAEMSHKGSILIVPSGIHGWQPELDGRGLPLPEAFAPVFEQADGIDVFLFGAGEAPRRLPREIREAFSRAGIVLECMTTGAAARTFNVLYLEQRQVAAGLIAVDND